MFMRQTGLVHAHPDGLRVAVYWSFFNKHLLCRGSTFNQRDDPLMDEQE